MAQQVKTELSNLIQVQQVLEALYESQKAGKAPMLIVIGFSKMKEINELSHYWGDTAMDQIDSLFQYTFKQKSYRLGASSAGIIIATNNDAKYTNKIKESAQVAFTDHWKTMHKMMPAKVVNSKVGQIVCDVKNYTINFYSYQQAIDKYKDKQDNFACTCKLLHNWNKHNQGFHDATFGSGSAKDNNGKNKYQCLSMDIDHLSKVISKYKNENEGRKAAAGKILDVGNSIADYVKTKLIKDRAWGYHNSGDEFSMVIIQCGFEDAITVGYRVIEHVKKQTGMSITVGRSHAMFYADAALENAKKNGCRGIVVTTGKDTTDGVYLAGPQKGVDGKYILKDIGVKKK